MDAELVGHNHVATVEGEDGRCSRWTSLKLHISTAATLHHHARHARSIYMLVFLHIEDISVLPDTAEVAWMWSLFVERHAESTRMQDISACSAQLRPDLTFKTPVEPSDHHD